MNEKDLTIIAHLRKDARIALTDISKKTQIPVSTIFDRLKSTEMDYVIKHTTLLDFEKLGYNSKNIFVIKVSPERRALLKDYLIAHQNVNNIYLTNSNYDYVMETVFRNQKDTQHFIEEIEKHFCVSEIKKFNIIEDIGREKFLSI